MITNIIITQQGDTYVITCTFDKTTNSATPSVQTIIVPIEAIADRRAFYGCTTDEEALGCILAEHYARLNGADQRPPVDPTTGTRRQWEDLTPDERKQAAGIARLTPPAITLPAPAQPAIA